MMSSMPRPLFPAAATAHNNENKSSGPVGADFKPISSASLADSYFRLVNTGHVTHVPCDNKLITVSQNNL